MCDWVAKFVLYFLKIIELVVINNFFNSVDCLTHCTNESLTIVNKIDFLDQ